jgi:hypothetical protein
VIAQNYWRCPWCKHRNWREVEGLDECEKCGSKTRVMFANISAQMIVKLAREPKEQIMKTETLEQKHTPGPWRSVEINGKRFIGALESGKLQVAQVTALRAKGVTKANAKLISAAPSLLEACKAAVSRLSYLDEGSQLVAMLDAAIYEAQS